MSDHLKSQNDDQLRALFDTLMKKEGERDAEARARKKETEAQRAASGGRSEDELVEGKVSGSNGLEVYVDLAERQGGVISVNEFDEPPQVGQSFQFSIVDDSGDLWTLSRKQARILETWQNLAVGKWVKARCTGTNTGGLEMSVGPLAAFMPVSQIDVARVEDPEAHVGETYVCEVLEIDEGRKRIVVSRRKVLEEERRKRREESMQSLAEGQVVYGTVEKVEPFGAFVSIGDGLTGLLHVSNMSYQRVEDPNTVVSIGQMVEVQVLKIEENGRRIGLGMKQLQSHPFDGASRRWLEGMTASGKVTRLMDFGAFVELEPGVEGLVHVSQIAKERVRRVSDHLKEGETITVRVISVDEEQRRMSLSRLTERGERIGSEEDEVAREMEEDTSGQVIRDGSIPSTGTNLGDLLRRAMEKGGD